MLHNYSPTRPILLLCSCPRRQFHLIHYWLVRFWSSILQALLTLKPMQESPRSDNPRGIELLCPRVMILCSNVRTLTDTGRSYCTRVRTQRQFRLILTSTPRPDSTCTECGFVSTALVKFSFQSSSHSIVSNSVPLLTGMVRLSFVEWLVDLAEVIVGSYDSCFNRAIYWYAVLALFFFILSWSYDSISHRNVVPLPNSKLVRCSL